MPFETIIMGKGNSSYRGKQHLLFGHLPRQEGTSACDDRRHSRTQHTTAGHPEIDGVGEKKTHRPGASQRVVQEVWERPVGSNII